MTGAEQMNAWGQQGALKYAFTLPSETPSNNQIKGMHFHAYKTTRNKWRKLVLAALQNVKPEQPLEKAALVVTRHCAGGLDWDNAYGGLKPMLDCLVSASMRNPDGLGLIKDDNPVAMPFPPFVRQVKAKRGEGFTEIQIFGLEGDVEPSADETAWGKSGLLRHVLELPVETLSNNTIKGMHFHTYKRAREQWHLMVRSALKGFKSEAPIQKAGLVVVRHCAGYLDWDNAYGGLKPMLDCLVAASPRNPNGLGLIVDDNPTAMPYPPYLQQVKAKRGNGSTQVRIYELH